MSPDRTLGQGGFPLLNVLEADVGEQRLLGKGVVDSFLVLSAGTSGCLAGSVGS